MEAFLFNEYQLETRRTAPPIEDVIGCLTNFSMGLSGESAEVVELVNRYVYGHDVFDKNKIAKELGDLLWYSARIADSVGIKFSELVGYQMFDDYMVEKAHNNLVINDIIEKGYDNVLVHQVMNLVASGGQITDQLKKVTFQGHEFDKRQIIFHLRDVVYGIAILSYMVGTKLSKVALMNIDKLRARYPKGFSVEDSINRKDKE